MTTLVPENALENYDLLLVAPGDAQVCVVVNDVGIQLPSMAIRRNCRPADEITSALLEKWSLDSVVIGWQTERSGAKCTAILEIRTPGFAPEAFGMSFIAAEKLSDHNVSADLTASLQQMLTAQPELEGPFCRFGWLDDARDWIQQQVPTEPLHFVRTRQLNAGGNFTLIRLQTNSGRAYWLKAVGAENKLEFSTTAFLSNRYPAFLPKIIGMRDDWSAWVMEDFGESLHSSGCLQNFESAVTKLARLQMQLVGQADELLRVPLVDHRSDSLKQRIDDIIAYLDDAMAKQTATHVKRISTARLIEIGVLLRNACEAIRDLEIPDSLLHGDISPGSILSNGTDCVFTDWCEAYVGNPFITFELLCVHMQNVASEPVHWRQRLMCLYKCSWMELLSEHQIDKAFQIVRLVAVLSYMYGNGSWLHSPRRFADPFQRYMRSLARHMDRIAETPEFRSLL